MPREDAPRTCPQCRFEAVPGARFCSQCGLKLEGDAPDWIPPGSQPAPDSPLRKVWQHPDLPKLFRHEPGHLGALAGEELPLLGWGLLGITGIGGLFLAEYQEFGWIGYAIAGVPVCFAVVFLLLTWRRIERYHEIELLRLPAYVVDLAQMQPEDVPEAVPEVPGEDAERLDPEDYDAVLTLEFENGVKRAFDVHPGMLRGLQQGDIGVAFLRDGVLLDFRRLRA